MNPKIQRLIELSRELREDQSTKKMEEYAAALDAAKEDMLSEGEGQLLTYSISAFACLLQEKHGSFTYLIPSVPIPATT